MYLNQLIGVLPIEMIIQKLFAREDFTTETTFLEFHLVGLPLGLLFRVGVSLQVERAPQG